MTTGEEPFTVVIVGGGTAGWMAAAAITKFLGPHAAVKLVESEEIGTVGVGEATIPQIKKLNAVLGLDEDDFVRRTKGTFKLGIEFVNWRRLGHAYIHLFGEIGLPIHQIPFHHYWARSAAQGRPRDLWDYCLNTAAARADKFARLDRIEGAPIGGLAYAFHFDAALYAKFLRQYAEDRGARRIEGRIVEVLRDGERGNLTGVKLQSGEVVAGDFFVDCSGFRSLLLGQILGVPYQDWSHWLPMNRAVAVPSAPGPRLRPYTQSIARTAGWQWRIPLQHRVGNGHVFSTDFISEDEATAMLLANLEGEALAEPRVISFVTGRREVFWAKNCVGLGLASGFLEPLESTSIHLIQSGISRLLSLFPNRGTPPATIAEYNRQMAMEFDRVRDFIILHYKVTERDDTPFWRRCRQMDVPEELTRKVELFRETGHIFREPEDIFLEASWLQVMVGQGVAPARYHPMADVLPADQLDAAFGHIETIVGRTVARLPTHAEFIAHTCAAEPAAA